MSSGPTVRAWVVAALMAGCNAAPSLAVDVENMCAEQAKVICHDSYRCCGSLWLGTLVGSSGASKDWCRVVLTVRCEAEIEYLRQSIESGRVAVDTEALQDCLELMIAPDDTCEATGMRPWNQACAPKTAWTTALVTSGGECDHYFECVDGTVCDGGRCVARAAGGEPCTFDVGCVEGHFCRLGSCLPQAGDGESCELDTSASRNWQCLDGLYCDEASVCRPLKELGEGCAESYECESRACDGECVASSETYNYCETVWYDRPLDELDP